MAEPVRTRGRDAAERGGYAAARARRVAAQAPVAVLVLAACAAFATVLEVVRAPERAPWMLAADGVYAAVVGVVLLLVRRRPEQAPAVLVVAANVVAVVQPVYHAVVGAPVAMCVWTLTAVLSSVAVLLPWGWRMQALACAGTVVSFPVLLLAPHVTRIDWLAGGTYVGWVIALSITAAALIDRQFRTDHERAAALAEREARLRTYVDLALVGTAVLSPAGAWIELNDALRRLLGQPAGLPLTVPWPDLVHPDDRAEERGCFRRALGTPGASATCTPRLIGADGRTREAQVAMCGLPGRDGAIDHVLVLVQDVTERMRLEERLRHEKALAESREREKSAFLALVSHELRTPMTIMFGLMDVVLHGQLAPEQRRHLEKARSATTTLVGLVNDVLDLARLDAGKLPLRPRTVAIRAWLADVLQPLGWLAEQRRLALAADVDPAVPVEILVDPDRLRQVVVNLVTNAIKFTDEGTVAVLVAGEADGGLRLSVVDTGPGIPDHLQATIFDDFTQLDPASPGRLRGSGLGLAIARRLTDLMGGRIWVESRPAHGSRFHVTIPAIPLNDAARSPDTSHVA